MDKPKREFTPEELGQEITLERINEYHGEVGEDFADQQTIGSPLMFAGFLLAKFPDKAKRIIELANEHPDIHCFQEIFGEEGTNEESDTFYAIYAEYINHTEYSKAEVNKVLILAKEHYNY